MAKILLVDDEKEIIQFFGDALRKGGFEVLTAMSGNECLKAAREGAPDLILLDINMPDMDGGDVCWHLSDDPVTKDIPVIFLSGMVTKEEEGDIRGHTCISKSSSIEETIKKLKIALGVPLK